MSSCLHKMWKVDQIWCEVFCCCFWGGGCKWVLPMGTKLASNSQSSSLCFLSAGITGKLQQGQITSHSIKLNSGGERMPSVVLTWCCRQMDVSAHCFLSKKIIWVQVQIWLKYICMCKNITVNFPTLYNSMCSQKIAWSSEFKPQSNHK